MNKTANPKNAVVPTSADAKSKGAPAIPKWAVYLLGAVVVAVATFVIYRAVYHDWRDATCTASRTCAICGQTEGEALGHTWKDATCTKPKTCTVCGATEGKALGHDYPASVWVIDAESICTTAGSRHAACSRCGEVKTESLPLAAHTEGDWQVKTEASINSSGKSVPGAKVKRCTVCGKELETEQYSLSAEEIEASFKEQCGSPSYDDVARNPDDWEGRKVVFQGKVIQVMESSGAYTLRVNVTQGRYTWDNTILVYYAASSGSSRILEDDVMTFYGTMNGMYSYKSVLGATITVPLMKASYAE